MACIRQLSGRVGAIRSIKVSTRFAARAMCVSATFGAAAASAQIEEIIVTAEKRSESVQDIGLSISAFNEEGLARAGIDDVSRLELVVPGVNFAYTGNDAKFNVRGANSTNTFNDAASIVGTFVDGVYKPRASQQSRAFFDVERVEFLKGPQGTLYGRNTFAGALNLHTNRPDAAAASGGIQGSFERFATIKFEGHFNLPVNDRLAIRIAGFIENGDGFIENTAGPDAGAPNDSGARVGLLLEPNDRFDALLRISSIRETGKSAGLFGYKGLCRNVTPQGLTDPFGTVRDCQNPNRGSGAMPRGDGDPWRISQDYVPDVDLQDDNITLELNLDAGPVLVKSISSYTDFKNNIGFDFDYSQNPYNVGGFDESIESFTQELQLSSNNDSAFQWTTGAYYSHDETFFSFTIFNRTVADNSVRPVVIGPNGSNFTVLNGTPLVSTATRLNGFFGSSQWIEIDTFGVFAQAELSINDRFRLIGGLRYNDESKDLTGGGSNFTANGPVTVNVAAGSSPVNIPNFARDYFNYNRNAPGANTVDASFDNLTWKAGFEHDLSSLDAMLYLTASTGFLSGAVNDDGSFTDEQESQLYELGIKSSVLDNRMRLNVGVHFTQYDNLLTQFQVPIGGIVQTFSRNGGELDAWGIELDAAYYPNDKTTLAFSAAFLDAEYKVFGQTNPYQLLNGQVVGVVDVAGATPGWSPAFTATIVGSHDFSLANGAILTPLLQFYYSDGYNTSNLFSLDPSQDQDAYTKTDLRLIWNSPNEKYSIEGFIENIEDEAVLGRGNNNSDDIVQHGFLYPRNYGLKFRVNWE